MIRRSQDCCSMGNKLLAAEIEALMDSSEVR